MAARKGRSRAVPPSPPESAGDEVDGEGAALPESATEDVLEEMRADGRTREPIAKIYRYDQAGKSVYLDQVALSLVTEEWLAQTYGGGRFNVVAMGEVPSTGKWGYVGAKRYDIDETMPFKGSLRAQQGQRAQRVIDDDDDPPRMTLHNPDGSRAGGNPIVDAAILNLVKTHQDNAQASNTFFLTMIQQMKESSQTERQMMMQMMERGNKGGDTLEKMMPLLTLLLPKLLDVVLTKRDPAMEALMPLLEKLTPKDEGTKLTEALSLMTQLRETADALGGGNERSGSSFTDILGKLAEALPMMLVQARVPQQPMPAGPTVTQRAPLPADVPTVAAAPSLTPGPMEGAGDMVVQSADDVWRIIGERINQVLTLAMMGRNPVRIAMMVVEFATPQQRALLTEVLADNEFTTQFFEKFPQMKVYTNWTNDFIEAMRDELLGSAEDEDDPQTDGGAE